MKKRTSIRLDRDTIELIDSMTIDGQSRTDIIISLLTNLKRKIFFDRLQPADREKLTRQYRIGDTTKTVQLRMPEHLSLYYHFNRYNIASAVKYAARHPEP